MSTEIENLSASFGLVKREFRDVHSVVSRMDHQMRRLFEPGARSRPGGLVAQFAAVELLVRSARAPTWRNSISPTILRRDVDKLRKDVDRLMEGKTT
jgi:hypothetical protein